MAEETNTNEETASETPTGGSGGEPEGASETAGGSETTEDTTAAGAGAAESAEPAAPAEPAQPVTKKSRLVAVVKNFAGDEVAGHIGSLVDIWNDEGISQEEIQKILDDLEAGDKEREAQLNILNKRATEINGQISTKLAEIEDSEAKVRRIDDMIAASKATIAAIRKVREAAKKKTQKLEDEATAQENQFLENLKKLEGK